MGCPGPEASPRPAVTGPGSRLAFAGEREIQGFRRGRSWTMGTSWPVANWPWRWATSPIPDGGLGPVHDRSRALRRLLDVEQGAKLVKTLQHGLLVSRVRAFEQVRRRSRVNVPSGRVVGVLGQHLQLAFAGIEQAHQVRSPSARHGDGGAADSLEMIRGDGQPGKQVQERHARHRPHQLVQVQPAPVAGPGGGSGLPDRGEPWPMFLERPGEPHRGVQSMAFHDETSLLGIGTHEETKRGTLSRPSSGGVVPWLPFGRGKSRSAFNSATEPLGRSCPPPELGTSPS